MTSYQKYLKPEALLACDGWATGKEEAMALFRQVLDRLARLERGALVQEAKTGAAAELAADAALKAKEAFNVAASAMRQSCKVPSTSVTITNHWFYRQTS